ncbi:GNAT family N-acetyltransferase [Membranicola marinus]|uniref:GNAT family N-acetyltransferase n=1 Tax=Membranihabitans marinus TaxID=1227546 RepID=A0A953LBK2_9BACT|nr:GNAT family N-acetyltransferase [Membranihabitans marinus]MBY5958631.1 GNAT family N-acetyltransferase [Membranihabitans marinus]
MNKVNYVTYTNSDFDHLLRMSQKLWTDYSKDQLVKLLTQTVKSEKYHTLIAKDAPAGRYAGFAIFSIRTDPVEGAVNSPTGYLEGIFVESDYRMMGIAKEFLRMGELWCKEKGCTQLGSDTWLTDQESRAFHKNMGFWEEEEVVHFLKNL